MRIIQILFIGLCLVGTATAGPKHPYSDIVIFGDSLSDPGNVFVLTGQSSKPPFDAGNIPSAPYARGGHHFTNGKTWSELLSKSLKLKGGKKPALKSPKNTNYAFGGARARSAGGPFDLGTQLNAHLANTGGDIDPDALYVIFLGGNDIRDALIAGDETASGQIIGGAIMAIANTIGVLVDGGAQHFLVPNAPNLGLVPAVTSQGLQAAFFGSLLSGSFNTALEETLSGLEFINPGINISRLDVFGYMTAVNSMPEAFGFENVVDACITPEVKKRAYCKKPKRYFFWDGIHPTKAVHKQIAKAAKELLLNPDVDEDTDVELVTSAAIPQ